MIQFYLITGFLGSGKTTLLKNLLSTFKNQRIAIIQNEFAPSGIDGKELKQESDNFKLIEVNNGSVFCVCQLTNFIESLKKLIKEYKPEKIFLEASGLADPISIAELLQNKEIAHQVKLNQVLSVVDAPNFNRGLAKVTRFKHQIMVADRVIINKEDLFTGDMKALHKQIIELNPFAERITTSFGKILPEHLKTSISSSHKASERFIGKQSEGRPDMNVCVLRSHDCLSEDKLEEFLSEMQKTCIRLKGFVNLNDQKIASFHTIFEDREIRLIDGYSGPTEIIAFGDNLSLQELRKKFKVYTN